ARSVDLQTLQLSGVFWPEGPLPAGALCIGLLDTIYRRHKPVAEGFVCHAPAQVIQLQADHFGHLCGRGKLAHVFTRTFEVWIAHDTRPVYAALHAHLVPSFAVFAKGEIPDRSSNLYLTFLFCHDIVCYDNPKVQQRKITPVQNVRIWRKCPVLSRYVRK